MAVAHSPALAAMSKCDIPEKNDIFDVKNDIFYRRVELELVISPVACTGRAGADVGLLSVYPAGGEYTGTDLTERSAAKEALLSFLIPGLGQYRMGHKVRSRIYFGLESVAWISAGAFYWQSVARRDAYKSYAVAYAGVGGKGNSDGYYETIGNYMSSEGPGGYNEYVLREARDLYYPDKAAMDAYYSKEMISGDLAWRWESERAFGLYGDLFAGSDASRRRAVYSIFFALGLRVVSMVDALRLAGGLLPESETKPGISIGVDPQPGGFRMTMCRSF